MNKVYLVKGERGEWDNYHWWIVTAYPDKESAEIHATLANKAIQKIKSKPGDTITNGTPYDPGCSVGDIWQSPKYEVQEVEFACHIDELIERGFCNGEREEVT